MLIAYWITGLVLLAALSAYAYWIHAPAPALPALSGAAARASLVLDGRERTWLRYTPAHLAPGAPLLLVLHGTGIDGARMRTWTGYAFDRLADRFGFVVVYPDGYKQGWNDCRKGGGTPAKDAAIDDVGFLRALVARMRDEAGIDPARVFAMGFSNGGQMGLRLHAEHPGMLAGLALVGANMPVPEDSLCTWQAPLPLMMVSGVDDRIVPYEGGLVTLFGRKVGYVKSALDTAARFAALADASGPHTTAIDAPQVDGKTRIELRTWEREGRAQVALYTVHNGGHTVPQPYFSFPRLLGRTSRALDTPTRVVDFFGLSKETAHA